MRTQTQLFHQTGIIGFILGLTVIWAFFVRLEFGVFDPATIDRVIQGETLSPSTVETIPQSLWVLFLVVSSYGLSWLMAVLWLINLREICIPADYQLTWQVTQIFITGIFVVDIFFMIFLLYLESYAISPTEIRLCIIVLDVATHTGIIMAAIVTLLCAYNAYIHHRLPRLINRTLLTCTPFIIIGEVLALNPTLPPIRTVWGIVMADSTAVVISTYLYLIASRLPTTRIENSETVTGEPMQQANS